MPLFIVSCFVLKKGAGKKKMKATAVRTKGTSGRRGGKAIKASKPTSKSTPPRKQARKSPAKVQKGRQKTHVSSQCKEARACKGKITQKAHGSRSSSPADY